MTIYVNHPLFCLMIPPVVLEALGKPKYIQLLVNAEERRIAIRAVAAMADGCFDVPPLTYEGNALVFPSQNELIQGTKKMLGWDDELYAVECFLVKDKNGEILVLADLYTARPSEDLIGPFTVPSVIDDGSDEGECEEPDEEDEE